MKKLKVVGFLILIVGAALRLWWLIVVGWAIYEAGGITWLAAATMDHGHGNHHDHGP